MTELERWLPPSTLQKMHGVFFTYYGWDLKTLAHWPTIVAKPGQAMLLLDDAP